MIFTPCRVWIILLFHKLLGKTLLVYLQSHLWLLVCSTRRKVLLKSKFFPSTQLVLSNSREERRNLYLVLFDYALHQINESCIASGTSDYSDDEVQPVAMLLMLADAPEALHISVKLGLEGILELLQRPISSALSKYPNSDRLSMVMLTSFLA